MDCEYCGKQLLNEQDITCTYNHVVCKAEYDRRANADMCVRCGENKTVAFACMDCGVGDRYKGYPGPA